MPVRWGILSTAAIGRVAAEAVRGLPEAQFVAVAGRDADRATAYAKELGLPRGYGSYDELLADDDVDAVYIPLPAALHTEWTIKALRAGKHVLCEKPLAMSAADAAACFDAADAAGRVCAEGLMWRHHPQTQLARRLLAAGAIGELAFIRAALSVNVPPGDIRRTGELGGGALLDLGCYCLSAVRLFGGEPLRAVAHRIMDEAPGADGSDLRLAATLTLPGDVLAQFDVALDYPRRDELELIGTAGKITVPDPWLCRYAYLEVERDGHTERVQAASPDLSPGPDSVDAYRLEFAAISRAITSGEPLPFGRDDAVAQATALEAVHHAARVAAIRRW